ncbi:MAG: ImmA/IrrE family metallo-endopeptidase [Treponema sp.]|jgi:Zn-dependent peptidase ImmA (M78 family)|nr:ImmA/IrrE family metallo-endopeptidase [Treponema sp.]
MTNNEIELEVLKILDKYVQRGGSHKQLLKIMQAEGIKFKEVSVSNDNFLGALTFGKNNNPYIMVNQSINNTGRRNFTIAHELGHYFLNHRLLSPVFLCQDSQINEDRVSEILLEREANYFATCLLMPEQKIKSAFLAMLRYSKIIKTKTFLIVNNKTYGSWCKIKNDLMKRYGVSEAALRYRLINLRLAEFEF